MLTPAGIFHNHMVLCRNKELRIFGNAKDGEIVTVQLGEAVASATAKDGRFLVLLPPMQAQAGLSMSISDSNTRYQYENVAIGEVFLAGGQSNMELELQNAEGGQECIRTHNDPDLRFYNVAKTPVLGEELLTAEKASCWQFPAPGQCKDVSAVAYFFAKRIREQLNIPVGIIDCYLGGTSISCWIDEEALNLTSAGQFYLADYRAICESRTQKQYEAAIIAQIHDIKAWEAKADELRAETPDISWDTLTVKLGQCPWPPPLGEKSPYRPAGLVDTMLKRVSPYALSGFLFYQGETDCDRTDKYRILLTTLIMHWRKLFMDDSLPFLNVQLPMFIDHNAVDNGEWALLRHAQQQVFQDFKHTGLAVLLDLGEFDNIHPTDKLTVGERLYQQARGVIYGLPSEVSPYMINKYAAGDKFVVTLSENVHATSDEPSLFEIAGEDGVYHKAICKIDGSTLTLHSASVPMPKTARYAHVNFAKVDVFSDSNLPLAPFE